MKRFLIIALLIIAPVCANAENLTHFIRDEVKKLDESTCGDGFSFAFMADSHQSTTVFENFIDVIDEMKPDFVVSSGDFTNDGKPEEYNQFITQVTRIDVPWFTVPGNHEYRSPQGHTSPDGAKRYKRVFGTNDFLFDHCGWRFIGLDVVAYDMLLPSQLNRLEKALKGHEDHSVVFMHYPPKIIDHWEEGIFNSNAGWFMKLLEQYRVRYFFSGHIHVHDKVQIGPTTYIVTGGSGGGLDRGTTADKLNSPDAGPYYHFIYVRVKNDRAMDMVIRPNLPDERR
ncbi:MAG TPA: metallophosphoesterase [bacterium]|nr:metallophosphoesterase [bacterium]